MKKKFTILLLIMAMLVSSFCLVSCGDDDNERDENKNNGVENVIDNDSEDHNSVGTELATGTEAQDSEISEEEAKSIVLARVNGASEREIVSFKKEIEDGRLVYEGSLYHEGIEYEFEIDAKTGKIIEWDIDD